MVGLCLLIGSRVTFFASSNIRNVRLVDGPNGRALHHLCSDPIYVFERINGGMLVRLG